MHEVQWVRVRVRVGTIFVQIHMVRDLRALTTTLLVPTMSFECAGPSLPRRATIPVLYWSLTTFAKWHSWSLNHFLHWTLIPRNALIDGGM